MGFPIRKSPGQSLFSDSPELIAASHVLHRLPAPRHPPYALSNLTIKFSQDKKSAAIKLSKNFILIYSFPKNSGEFYSYLLLVIASEAWQSSVASPERAKQSHSMSL